ncbi:hypothetical protein HZ326_31641 [Fusarium oxysporum f. sp. albedinis]|nr:hypothetical protein HZ326_31641 [Fusarium oxysporum f. sp. albedinis]
MNSTALFMAHRLGLDNKRPYSGGLNRPSERISPSSAVWLLTYSASPPCLRKQSESSQAQDGRLDGIEVACLPKWCISMPSLSKNWTATGYCFV